MWLPPIAHLVIASLTLSRDLSCSQLNACNSVRADCAFPAKASLGAVAFMAAFWTDFIVFAGLRRKIMSQESACTATRAAPVWGSVGSAVLRKDAVEYLNGATAPGSSVGVHSSIVTDTCTLVSERNSCPGA